MISFFALATMCIVVVLAIVSPQERGKMQGFWRAGGVPVRKALIQAAILAMVLVCGVWYLFFQTVMRPRDIESIAVAALFWAYVFRQIWTSRNAARDAKDWMRADARITFLGEAPDIWKRPSPGTFKVDYEYRVGNQDHRGNALTVDGLVISKLSYRRLYALVSQAFRSNQPIVIYVNPCDHADSAILNRTDILFVVLMVGLLVFVSALAAIVIYGAVLLPPHKVR